MNDKSDSKSELSRVLEKIQEIVEKSADGDYIYRGEPKCYPKVSSSLYREYFDVEAEHFDIAVVQNEILDRAREYVSPVTSDFEILTELRHRGGSTNVIDFTTDYLIALFFACDGSYNKPGRVILLGKESENYKIEKASKTINRAESQKSIFVQSDTGFIKPEQYKVICIPSDLKTHMLDYLQKHHDISTRTIYNDLQGFIENQHIHQSAYTEFFKGMSWVNKAYSAKNTEERQQWWEKAVVHFTETLELDPQMFEAYNNRGIAYSERSEYDRAIRDYDRAIELKSDYAEVYNNRGIAYSEKDEIDRAIRDYDRAIELKSDYAEVYNNRGIAYSEKDEIDRAIRDYDRAIELKSDYVSAYYNRGIAYSEKDEIDRAIRDYDRAIELNPNNAAFYNNRGNTYVRKGEFDEAIRDHDRAIELDPDGVDTYCNRGIAYSKKGEQDKAIQDHNRAIELRSNDAGFYNGRGIAYLRKGEYKRAIQDYDRAMELDPNDSDIYCNRGEAWFHLKEWEKAKVDLITAKNMGKDIIASFHNDYESVEDFEQKNDIQLPEDIKAMLQQQ